jgi:CheY-like chemotaxis protein
MNMSQETEQLSRGLQASRKTILVVEDDPYISSFLFEAIDHETPYQAIVASDSKAALNLVRHFAPSLFVLDYGLPGMNGIELYDRLHINQHLATIPAILITANRYLPQQQIQQRHLAVFTKPLELEPFLETIETLLAS